MFNLVRVGQIKIGDTITLTYRGNQEEHQVEDILSSGKENEEIIIDIHENKYFITSMAIDGDSWAKNVEITM